MEKFILEKKTLGAVGLEKEPLGLSGYLQSHGFELGRMKTGTPPRIDGRSINYKLLEEDSGDKKVGNFSFLNEYSIKKQKPCYMCYTNEKVHQILGEV